MENTQELLQTFEAMLQLQESQTVAHAQERANQEVEKTTQQAKERAGSELKRGGFLLQLVDQGHAKLVEILDPAFLQVKSIQEALAEVVRALGILHDEAFHEDKRMAVFLEDNPRADRTSEFHARHVLTHLAWAEDKPVEVGHTSRYMGGLLGTTPRSHTHYRTKHTVVPTQEGRQVIDAYRSSIGLPSAEEQKKQWREHDAQQQLSPEAE